MPKKRSNLKIQVTDQELNLKKPVNQRNISYDVQLNEEQKEAKRTILENTVTILTGKAGSGKTIVAVATALDLYFKKEIKKIYITRPLVTREEIGFLPGDISQKLDPFLIPIYENLKKVYNRGQEVEKLIADKVIDIAPMAYMRGRTFDHSVLIADEFQNCNDEDIKMCLTRIGQNGKIILCGDCGQIDLKSRMDSSYYFLVSLQDKVKGLKVVDLKSNHRHPIVEELLALYEERDARLHQEKTLRNIKRTA